MSVDPRTSSSICKVLLPAEDARRPSGFVSADSQGPWESTTSAVSGHGISQGSSCCVLLDRADTYKPQVRFGSVPLANSHSAELPTKPVRPFADSFSLNLSRLLGAARMDQALVF